MDYPLKHAARRTVAARLVKVTYLPVLRILRDLYLQPRDMQRFRKYVATLTGGTDDVVLPIGVANPMAREHAVTRIDELLAMGADEIAAEATASAQARLAHVQLDVEIKATLVLADDVAGGWTNRFTTEASVRFPSRGALKRPFATALAWTSELPSAAQIREEVLAAIYRVAYQQRHGLPTTLLARREQEGLAGVFAGTRPGLAGDDLERARAIELTAAPGNEAYPEIFAWFYGDAAAEQLGYRPLGLPARAGFDVAVADALERRVDPVAALLPLGPRSVEHEPKRARKSAADQHRRRQYQVRGHQAQTNLIAGDSSVLGFQP